jgi:hypothetical protein
MPLLDFHSVETLPSRPHRRDQAIQFDRSDPRIGVHYVRQCQFPDVWYWLELGET